MRGEGGKISECRNLYIEERNLKENSFGETKRKRSLEISVSGKESNIWKNFIEIDWKGVDCIRLAQCVDNLWALLRAVIDPMIT